MQASWVADIAAWLAVLSLPAAEGITNMRRRRASRTALKVSKGVLYIAEDPELVGLLPSGAVECTRRLLTGAGLLKGWELRLFQNRRFRRFAAFMERHTIPGASLHVALRKRFLEDETRLAITQGASQVVAVGAGLDTLSVRLAAEYPEVTFIEIDRPATVAAKGNGLEAMGAQRRNLHLVGADLAADELDQVLARVGSWRPDALSVVVAEGVLMYLDAPAVERFLTQVRENTKRGSRLLMTYMRTDDRGQIWIGKLGFLTRLSLRLSGEPLRWATSHEGLETLLARHGYRLASASDQHDVRRRYLEPAGLADRPLGDVEYLAIAETL